jgi:hypothetical protein
MYLNNYVAQLSFFLRSQLWKSRLQSISSLQSLRCDIKGTKLVGEGAGGIRSDDWGRAKSQTVDCLPLPTVPALLDLVTCIFVQIPREACQPPLLQAGDQLDLGHATQCQLNPHLGLSLSRTHLDQSESLSPRADDHTLYSRAPSADM